MGVRTPTRPPIRQAIGGLALLVVVATSSRHAAALGEDSARSPGNGSTAIGAEGAAGPAESGIAGKAVIGPTRPSRRVGDPAPESAPYQTTLVVSKASDAKEVARVKTGADGTFRVRLPPGEYVVRPLAPPGAPRRWPRAEPARIKVLPGKFARLTISFDSGMR